MSQTKTVFPLRTPRRLLPFIAFSLLFLMTASLCRAQIDQSSMIMNAKLSMDSVGNGRMEATIKFNPPRIYDRVKKAYPNLYVLFRDLIANDRASTEVDRSGVKINADDGSQTINFTASVLSAAVNRSGSWQIVLAKGESLVTNENGKVITSLISVAPNGMILNGTGVYDLPSGAQSVKFDKESHLLTYTMPGVTPKKPLGSPQIELNLRYRKNVMSALYKIYADPDAADGRYWVAKTIIKNTGTAPMRDVKVTYNMGEYADSYTSRPYTSVLPRGAVVDCYYPLFSSKVAQLKTRTPMQLSVKVEYKDANGASHTEERSERLSMLGINQFEFSDLSEEEKTDSWYDHNNNGPLLSAYVTKIDDPVKQLAGYISEAAGGVAAAGKFDDAVKWMRAAYNMELVNNIVYQTPSSEDFGQDIKYPRDVLRAKSGTCVDLAILYASLAESVGLHSYLMLVPGHCFSVVQVEGQYIAVENTGLGGGDRRMSFDQAVQAAQKEMQQYMQQGLYYLIDIDAQQGAGRVPSPELPQLESNFLDTVGIRRTGLIVEQGGGPQNGGGGRNTPQRPDVTANPTTNVAVGNAGNFEGKWSGDMDGAPIYLLLDQADEGISGTVILEGDTPGKGTFKKVNIGKDNSVKIHVRITGSGRTYSLTLDGKRDGDTIKGSGTLVTRGLLDVALDTRNISFVTHYAGKR